MNEDRIKFIEQKIRQYKKLRDKSIRKDRVIEVISQYEAELQLLVEKKGQKTLKRKV